MVSGRWPFSSGVDNSEWNMLGVTVYGDERNTPVDWRLCLVPKTDYRIIDTWYAMGLAGTGSKDVELIDVFVPERRALSAPSTRGGGEHPGAAVNPGPLFRIPLVAGSGYSLSGTALDAAQGAYEMFVETMSKRIGTYTGAKVADFQALQVKLARACCLIDSARSLMRESAIAFQEFAERNEVPDLRTKLRLRVQNAFAVAQSREAVETLWSCYGANAVYMHDPLQRYLRDVQAACRHFSFNFDIAGAAFGLAALGGNYLHPSM